MAYDAERLNAINDRTNGYCHICHKKVAFKNYAQPGARGAWEVDHSIARARGGTERLNNLFPACIPCNRGKMIASSRSARAAYGETRAPRSLAAQARVRTEHTAMGALAGGFIGMLAGGPAGAAVGAAIGGAIGGSGKKK